MNLKPLWYRIGALDYIHWIFRLQDNEKYESETPYKEFGLFRIEGIGWVLKKEA